jgi:hypothetical protein
MSKMDSQAINKLLHSGSIRQHYKARPGDVFGIELPRVPFTRSTEFLRLEKEISGNPDCIVEEATPDPGEGAILPRQIFARALRTGKAVIVLRAIDSLSGQEIPDVEPFRIEVEVEEE